MAKDSGKLLGWLLVGLLGYSLVVKAKDRPIEEMREIIKSQATLPEIRRMVAQLTKNCHGNEVMRVESIFRFVADQFDYMPDPWDEDHFSEALETIYVGAGDCDCKSILLATLLRANGFPVALDLVPGHVLVEVCISPDYCSLVPANALVREVPNNGGQWVFLESTVTGAQIGWVDSTTNQQLINEQENRIQF